MPLSKNKSDPEAYEAGLRDFRRGWSYNPKGYACIRESGRRFSHMVASYRAGYDQGEVEAIEEHNQRQTYSSASCLARAGWMSPGH